MNEEHWLTLIPETPLCIGLFKTSRFISSRSEIPGSILRGTLARYIRIKGGADHILDVVSRMRFGFFRPSPSKDAVSLPFPLTAQECKRAPGFSKENDTSENGHGISDFLIPFIAYEEIGGSTPWLIFDVPFSFTCPFESDGRRCDSRMEQARGYYIFKDRRFEKVRMEHISQTKVSIDRRTRTAKEGMLFSITGVSRKILFSGRVWGPEEYVKELEHALRQYGVGALTGRGFGNVNVERSGSAGIDTIKNRIEEFNERLLHVWKDISSLSKSRDIPFEPEATYFTVDLLSPAIFRYPIPSTRLHLTIEGIEHKPVCWFTEPTFVGGWSPALGLPKSTHLGADIGSTYVFKTDLDLDTLVENLEELEANGVGFRTDEGYGETIVCHPFHLEVNRI
ncbi:MAG: CRISPR-associated RAMP protein Csx10 [Candidatus Methanofastidiosia archaeon]